MMFIKCPMDPDISFSQGHRKHPSHYTRDELPRLGYGWIHQGLSEDVVYPKSKLLAVSWPFSCGGLQSLISRHDVICTSEVSAPHFWPFKNMYIYIYMIYIYIYVVLYCVYINIFTYLYTTSLAKAFFGCTMPLLNWRTNPTITWRRLGQLHTE